MAAIAASSSSGIAGDGPVLNLLNKRLRALRKKLNRISQMEESLSMGKSLNKDQEDTLRSKPVVIAGIDELERLRQPLMQAVDQEIENALEANKRQSETRSEDSNYEEKDVKDDVASDESIVDAAISDLLDVVYFGSIFDVGTLLMVQENMLMRTHERNYCLLYDYVTDDEAAGEPLEEWDLDLIATMGRLMISRPVNSCLSHKESLKLCVQRAKLWLSNSDEPILPDSNLTYASLKQRLNKIMASDYFTTTPDLRAPAEVAAAMANYASFQVPLHDSMVPQVGFTVTLEGSAADFEQEEENLQNYDGEGDGNVMYDGETLLPGEVHQFMRISVQVGFKEASEVDSSSELHAQTLQDLLILKLIKISVLAVESLDQQYANGKPYQNVRCPTSHSMLRPT